MTTSPIYQQPIHPALSALPVSDGARRVASMLWAAVLASGSDLAALLEAPPPDVYARLTELKENEFAESKALGWQKEVVERWWLTDELLVAAGITAPNYHQEWGRCRLLERLPILETGYQAMASVSGLGRLVEVQWPTGTALNGVANYQGGWCAILWSGLLESETHLDERMESLGLDLLDWSTEDQPAWPSLFVFVVHDRWQEELVLRVARKRGIEDQVAVMCAADGRRRGNWTGGRFFAHFFQPIIPMDLGGEGWEKRAERTMAGGEYIRDRRRVSDIVTEWAGMEVKFAKKALGEDEKGRRATRACKTLADWEMVERRQKGGKGYRYAIGSKGFRGLAMRDGVGSGTYRRWRRVPEWEGHPQLQAHEDGLMEMMAQLMAEGLHVANGTRSWEHMGREGAIAPDGMVYLLVSPYGEGWHYVEYERSARRSDDALSKLNGYMAASRQDDWPVLFVLWDEAAEKLFQQLGTEGGLKMLTTTLDRLKAAGAVGLPGCWSRYGEDVVIGRKQPV